MFPSTLFKDKHILVGITGGIAAYKITELIRFLVTNEAEVRVVMTRAAEKFITQLTMETLSQNPVETDLFPERDFSGTHHVHLADWADATIIAPASYNFIGKLNAGIADDLLSTIIAAVHTPTVVAPAMNVHMWNNPVLQKNLFDLRKQGYLICPPGEGFLAEGYEGIGRLAALEHMIQFVYRAIHPARNSFAGKNILITASRTEETLDPVRVFTNRSSGKMGYALAWEAFARGANVSLVHGPTQLPDPVEMELVPINSTEEMFTQVKKRFPRTDLYLSAAAIADFNPEVTYTQKLKKEQNGKLNIKLKPTIDILKYLSNKKKKNQQLVGFAMETHDTIKNAQKKLKDKNLDLIVSNNISEKDAGFEKDTNRVSLIPKNGKKKDFPLLPKLDVAFQIFQELVEKK
jgi:phosphopantothenoylcysteine decarboxylase/phosphopantothenate--cysteine ligase